ncbi:MAG: cytochrome d ubiquinol oxidase subunit II [Desulfobacteraceae bacterium]|nr:cytochrome d ubiquinol oxidase subunit II [Desulfobacteraceae bacterium]
MLETIWFALWGILWAVYFVLDGFDLGIGTLGPFVAGTEDEKRAVYDSMAPYWNGNEVWLITAGGVTFAAFPKTYAVMFSSLYSALLLILFALIVRGVSMEFRSKFTSGFWKRFWDTSLWIGNFLPALLFGVAFANFFRGILIDGEGVYQGTLFSLLNVYGLMGGVLFVLIFLVHGALWLTIHSKGPLRQRAARAAGTLWYPLLAMAVVFLVATYFSTKLYENYLKSPFLLVIPAAAVGSLLMIRVFVAQSHWWKAWTASAVFVATVTLFGVTGLYPNLLVSSIDPMFSLTAFNSSSSPLTLKIMLGVALVFVPIVIAYQVWVYRFFARKENSVAPEVGPGQEAAAARIG